jgi:hypothetical protein
LEALAVKCASIPTATCDERPFNGLSQKALAEMGHPGDIIEVHYRPGKSLTYKAKRGYVGQDGWFRPATWPDGSCRRIYSYSPFTERELGQLLDPGESLQRLQVTSPEGTYNTIAVYAIVK